MAQVFTQALGPQPPTSAYDQLLQEYQQLLAAESQPPKPMYNQEQQGQRIRQNNDLMNLGVLGELSGESSVQGVGGKIFSRALQDRTEKATARGTFDPLTGETAESPEYQQEQRTQRRGRVLEQALRFEEQRQRAKEREERAAADRRSREDMVRLAASLRPTPAGQDPGILDLRRQLLEAQIKVAKDKSTAAGAKVQATKDKARTAAQNAAGKANIVIGKIDEALGMTNKLTTGVGGAVMRRLPGTEATDLEGTINTIKANIGFEELQAMRQASPTGGALGQVAVQELNFLQAVLGNLDPRQSRPQVEKNLQSVKRHFQNWKNIMEQAAGTPDTSVPASMPSYGGSTPPVPAQPPPAPAASSGRIRMRVDPRTGDLVSVTQ